MYYILNETNQIIAADESLLHLCGYTHINELNTDIILEKITFKTPIYNQLTIKTANKTVELTTHEIPLSTLLGKLTLIQISENVQTTPNKIIEDEINIDHLIIKHDEKKDDVTLIQHIEEETTAEDIQLNNIENDKVVEDTLPSIITSKLTEEKENIYIDVASVSKEIGVSEEDYHAFLNEYITTALELEKDLQSSKISTRNNAINTISHLSEVLHLDTIEHIIKKIKESTDENRMSYITTFYDTLSRIVTKKSSQSTSSHNDKEVLLNLDSSSPMVNKIDTHIEEKNVISLPEVDTIDETLPEVDKELFVLDLNDTPVETVQDKKEEVSYKEESINLDLDAKPVTSTPKEKIEKENFFELNLDDTPEIVSPTVKSEPIKKEENITLDLDVPPIIPETKIEKQAVIKEMPVKETKPTPTHKTSPKTGSFGTLDLSKIAPIHFDFSLHAAADELSLPESLIEEFMIDFVEQAHTETDKMLEAYKKGDLESIQKIGHLLKGVSSNLRITALSDTLYKIQFCDNPDNLESLIKDYWGHFLAFEKQINLLSK